MNADIKKLLEWHAQQANKNKELREFHTWAAKTILKALESK